MNFTMPGLRPTTISDGLGGNSFNSTHIVRTYGADVPHELSFNATNMAQLFSATDRYNDKPMLGMTEAKGKKMYLSNNIYTWKLRGHQKQKLRVVEVVETASRPGENFTEFTVILDKSWFKYPDVLIGEDNRYPVEVVGKPKMRGTGYEYVLKLQTSDPNRYFPTNLIQVGQEFTKVSTSIAEEMNSDYGTMQFNSVFELRNQLGYVAEKVEFTDRMLRVDKNSTNGAQWKHWRVPFLDDKGKVYMNFMPMAEAEMWNQVYSDIEWGLNYGRQSLGRAPNGYLKRTGPGWREQFEFANTLYHNGNLSLSRLDEWLSSIYRGRKDATPQSRKIVLMTGEMGALMFDRMVSSEASSFLTLDTHFISGGDPRHLSFGAQYTHYRGKNGLDITVMLNPQYDDPDLCPQMHQIYTDTTQDSWRMDIFDFGATTQDDSALWSNIKMVCEQYSDHYFVSTGKWDPKTGMPINDGKEGLAGGVGGYSVQVEKSYGLMIEDISRCGTIQLRFDN